MRDEVVCRILPSARAPFDGRPSSSGMDKWRQSSAVVTRGARPVDGALGGPTQ
jgi:hypothetical protein